MPGLRCCSGLSRHSSVVSSAPLPFTSIEPPSSTTRCLAKSGRTSIAPAALATRLPIFSSRRQLGYLAQALKRHLTARMAELRSAGQSGAPVPPWFVASVGQPRAAVPTYFVRKVQPESRVQTRSVGQRWKRTFFARAFARSRTFFACFSEVASLTISSTRSCLDK